MTKASHWSRRPAKKSYCVVASRGPAISAVSRQLATTPLKEKCNGTARQTLALGLMSLPALLFAMRATLASATMRRAQAARYLAKNGQALSGRPSVLLSIKPLPSWMMFKGLTAVVVVAALVQCRLRIIIGTISSNPANECSSDSRQSGVGWIMLKAL